MMRKFLKKLDSVRVRSRRFNGSTALDFRRLESRCRLAVTIHSPDHGFPGDETLTVNGTGGSNDSVAVGYSINNPSTHYDDSIKVWDKGSFAGCWDEGERKDR